jgi:hypothetical protein
VNQASSERIEGYRDELRALLGEADALLDLGTQVHSDLWFDLATRLAAPATCIGAAIYCLLEWSEPDDVRPDDFSIFWTRETSPATKRQLLTLIFERVWLDEQRVAAVQPKLPFRPLFPIPAARSGRFGGV